MILAYNTSPQTPPLMQQGFIHQRIQEAAKGARALRGSREALPPSPHYFWVFILVGWEGGNTQILPGQKYPNQDLPFLRFLGEHIW